MWLRSLKNHVTSFAIKGLKEKLPNIHQESNASPRFGYKIDSPQHLKH